MHAAGAQHSARAQVVQVRGERLVRRLPRRAPAAAAGRRSAACRRRRGGRHRGASAGHEGDPGRLGAPPRDIHDLPWCGAPPRSLAPPPPLPPAPAPACAQTTSSPPLPPSRHTCWRSATRARGSRSSASCSTRCSSSRSRATSPSRVREGGRGDGAVGCTCVADAAPCAAWVDSTEGGRGGPRVQALLLSKWTQRLLESLDEDSEEEDSEEEEGEDDDEED